MFGIDGVDARDLLEYERAEEAAERAQYIDPSPTDDDLAETARENAYWDEMAERSSW